MKLLLDTHLLLWASATPSKLSSNARKLIEDTNNELLFSTASIWEIVIKHGLGRKDFRVEPRVLRRGLLDNGYDELAITSLHAVTMDTLPPIHKDPFDRIIIAQAIAEGITLITTDSTMAKYPGPVRKV
ncbi:MAG: type II toxin-antitoxin system VapC family toxin [Candidatus Obscuribacterales bacterium]|nr:type II toxin-antitoxin system VapC family toxin [Candidatus Obscuribacterales bacterium]